MVGYGSLKCLLSGPSLITRHQQPNPPAGLPIPGQPGRGWSLALAVAVSGNAVAYTEALKTVKLMSYILHSWWNSFYPVSLRKLS